MKKITCFIVFFILMYPFAGCVFYDRDVLCRIWFYGDESAGNDFDSSYLTPVSFISLYANGTYTRDFGAFEYGRWSTRKSTLVLVNYRNKMKVYGRQYTWPNSLKLFSNGYTAGFEGQPSLFTSAGDDPFSLQNNQWRVPATHKETNQELMNRLLNHCHFWEMYFSWALKNKMDYLDVRSTPTLLRIYGNGFVLKSFETLPARWHAYFFDDDDCRKANDMMKEIFQQHDIKVPDTKDKYKMFILLFQQLEHALH
jgi:hypothetical protein